MKRTAGSTILEVIVSLTLFLMFTGMFFHFLNNVQRLIGQAMDADRENQELWKAYYLGESQERRIVGEGSGISFYLLDEEGGLSEEGFTAAGISLMEYGRSESGRKIYVLEQSNTHDEKSKGNYPAGTDGRHGAEQFDSGSSGIFSVADNLASPADSVRSSRRESQQQHD